MPKPEVGHTECESVLPLISRWREGALCTSLFHFGMGGNALLIYCAKIIFHSKLDACFHMHRLYKYFIYSIELSKAVGTDIKIAC